MSHRVGDNEEGGHSIETQQSPGLYHLNEARYQQRLAQLNDEHDPVEAMYDLLALTRLIINKRLNATAFQEADLNHASPQIAALQSTVERVQRSANTIEQNLKVFLTKPTVLSVGRLLIQIIADELQGISDYDRIVPSITQQINSLIRSANNQNVQRTQLRLPSSAPRKRSRLFQLQNAEDQARFEQLREHEGAKLLREDIALCVLMIQVRVDGMKTAEDLVRGVSDLNQQLRSLEKLFKSAHDLEQIVGTLLTPETFQTIGTKIGDILKDELSHVQGFEDRVERIVARFQDSLANKEAAQARLLGMDSMG